MSRQNLVMRRHTLGLAATLLLAACGGGGDNAAPTPPPAAGNPTITRFEATAGVERWFVGDTARLRADFTGGNGRLEPGLGVITSGLERSVGPLDRDQSLRLVVSAPGKPDASRDLTLRVDFRDRYQAGSPAIAISEHVAVATGEGNVLLMGGRRGQSTFSSQIDRYDPSTQRIERLGDLASGRINATATRLANGQVLLAGGELTGTDWRIAELVNERTGAVTPAGRMSVMRIAHAAILLPNGSVLVTGGSTSGEGAALGLSRSAEVWEPGTQTFRRLNNSMVEGRSDHTMSMLPDGRVLIVGGFSNALTPVFAEVFDPRTEQFTALTQTFTPRAEHAAFTLPDGRVLIVGGEQPQAGSADWVPTNSVLRFDPATGQFTAMPPLAAARTMVAGALLPSGEVLVFGGRNVQTQNSATAERYSPTQGGRAIAAMDTGRAFHTVTRLPTGRVAVIGGETRDGNLTPATRVYE